ncbi:MAG: family 20 glycosylhydrolase [Clostridia bacterium]|nr:family 20 glycosylhydrolase [Clostridia bacterium]
MAKTPFSVCFDFSGESAALREGIECVAPDLGMILCDEGIKVSFCRAEGNALSVIRKGDAVTITYGERIHAFRALSLLAQHINDTAYQTHETCYFNSNGVMFDVSQSNTLMTVDHVKLMLRRMAQMGLNRLMLYNEDNYEIEGWPYFGYMRSRYSEADIRELDDYAFALGIELVPCIQTLAHLVDALKWPSFSGMREDRACLLPGEERVYAFLEKAIVAATAPVRTKRIHIGMDEAMKLGRGHYFDKHGYVNAGEIMLSHLNRVMEILRRHDLEPMLWGDMFFQRIFGKYSYYQQDYGNQQATTVPVTLPNGMKQEADLSYIENYPKDARLIAYGYTPIPMKNGI